MKTARAFDAARLPAPADGAPHSSASSCAVVSGSVISPVPDSQAFNGYPSVGKLFFKAEHAVPAFCTASVIGSSKPPAGGSMLILTAAHCYDGTVARLPYTDTDFAFAPAWNNGKSPLGLWAIGRIDVYQQWLECPVPLVNCHTDPIYDYAVMTVTPLNGKNIGAVTGTNGVAVNQPKQLSGVQIVGYSEHKVHPWRAVTKTVTTTSNKQVFRSGKAPGLGLGSSGGPWYESFGSGVGVIIGDTGGLDQGGPDSGVPSYSDFWDDSVLGLVKTAAQHECATCS
jgi:hypothetical protein